MSRRSVSLASGLVGLVALGLVGAWARPCLAAESEVAHARLRYELDDPEGLCENEAAFRARVVRRLGYSPFREDAALDLRIRVVARGPIVHAEIASSRGGKPAGKRVLEDPRCDALGETLASAVALALDPVAAASLGPARDVEAEPLPPPLPPPASVHAPSAPASTASAPSAPQAAAAREEPSAPGAHVEPLAYFDATVGFARAPAPLFGGRVGVGLRYRAFSLALEGHAQTLPSPATLPPNDRIDVTVVTGALVPCGTTGVFQLCGVLSLGSRQAKALDVVNPERVGTFFASLGIRPGVEVPLGGILAFRAHAEAGVLLVRTRYTINFEPRVDSALLEASLGLGIIGRFR